MPYGNSKSPMATSNGASPCRTYGWNAGGGTRSPSQLSCAAVVAAPRQAAPTTVRVVRPLQGADRPDRLAVVSSSGVTLRSWPLPIRVRRHTLQVSGALASYSALGGNGLWVTRLTDGHTTFVAPVRAGDRPRLGARGVAYVDNVYKHAPASRPILKFVPTSALAGELEAVGRPVHAGGVIRSFSMDGTRIALAVSGGASGCDRVVFWDVPWRSVEQVSQQHGVTCAATGASRRITQVALGGARAQWVTSQHGSPVVVAADDIGCQEWVIRRLADLPGVSLHGIAADGANVAFALAGRGSSSVGVLTGSYRGIGIYGVRGLVRAISADGFRTAVLSGHRIQVHGAHGGTFRTIVAPGATAVALRGNMLVATTATGRLDVYAGTMLAHSWRLPAGTLPHVDLQYGIAVVTTPRAVYAIDAATGRTALLATTPSTPRAQIESIGVGYVYGNWATVIPMTRVEAAVR